MEIYHIKTYFIYILVEKGEATKSRYENSYILLARMSETGQGARIRLSWRKPHGFESHSAHNSPVIFGWGFFYSK
jgi:hypothetical protein